MAKKYIASEVEPKWQKKWEEDQTFSPNVEQAKKPYYSLMMFPYPSAEGLHVGNMYAFTGSDIFSRLKRMQGYDVFEPIGLDGFGIHSENYALKVNQHPMDLSKVTEERFYKQLHIIGNSYDWSRTVETYKPNYYKWTQWLFLKMYEKGLAFKQKASVNWCPSCLTVLADEQVINGSCERCASTVEKRMLEQWFFKITDYAEKLLGNIEGLDWSQKVKIAQRDWIGKSEGVLLKFKVQDQNTEIEVFTTALDTVYGVSFLVISPENPLLNDLVTQAQKEQVEAYIKQAKEKTELERTGSKEKTGVFTGSFVINPFNNKQVPVWVADYVLATYGTGAVMGVAGHDQRDYEFAKKFELEIIPVIKPTKVGARVGEDGFWDYPEIKTEFADKSVLFNSGEYDGLASKEAKIKMSEDIEEKELGKRQIQYHLRDWLISRQRYWGPPIPIIYCDDCGTVPVPEKDLPVELPFVQEFRPTGTGKSPLASVEEFYKVACPECGKEARRETDVSDTFLDSSWYFLRYPCTDLNDKPFDKLRIDQWLPVNMYIGGAEHSVLHLLYSRFVTMVLKDLGYIEFEEPFKTFRAHGLIIKDGAKMSKSKGNIVNPDEYIKEYGADVLRTYLMFVGPFSEGGDFRDSGLQGIYRFLQRIWSLQDKIEQASVLSSEDLKIMHKTIKKVTEDLSELKYNTAIACIMEWLNSLSRRDKISADEYLTLIKLLAPFAPHITEELWQIVTDKNPQESASNLRKSSIHKQSFPIFDNRHLAEDMVQVIIQVNGKVRDTLMIENDIVSEDLVVEKLARESTKVQKFLDGEAVKKVIYIHGKIINFVI
jgi:leucyl-tRNA synthetase